MRETVTIREFAALLEAEYKDKLMVSPPLYSEDEGEDICKRSTAARILHDFLRKQLHEKEIDNINPAAKLPDLYDCHTCVNAIAQVYLKGIMTAVLQNGTEIFGHRLEVTKDEASVIIRRALSPECRVNICGSVQATSDENGTQAIPDEITGEAAGEAAGVATGGTTGEATGVPAGGITEAIQLTTEEALAFIRREKRTILIDLRSLREYENDHLQGAKHMTLTQILEMMEAGDANVVDYPVILYCQAGTQAAMAGNCLVENGYKYVYWFKYDAYRHENYM